MQRSLLFSHNDEGALPFSIKSSLLLCNELYDSDGSQASLLNICSGRIYCLVPDKKSGAQNPKDLQLLLRLVELRRIQFRILVFHVGKDHPLTMAFDDSFGEFGNTAWRCCHNRVHGATHKPQSVASCTGTTADQQGQIMRTARQLMSMKFSFAILSYHMHIQIQ